MIRFENFKPDDFNQLIKELPDPFLFQDGSRVRNKEDWEKRREELKQLIQQFQYGWLPPAPDSCSAELFGSSLQITVEANGSSTSFTAEVTLPESGECPCPVFINTGGLDADLFLTRGYALVRFQPNEIALDHKGQRSGSFYSLYPDWNAGALMAWAWGFHRVMDALSVVPQIDRRQVAITGHSRFGKASLAAGVFDERIQLTIPASSGLAGVGNYRFFYEEQGPNEKIGNIFGYAPHWFTPSLGEFINEPGLLPFDQHSVISLIAPRALLITEGTEDHWNNPRGTGLSYRAARKVFEWLGVKKRIGIAYRAGGHGMTRADFEAMIDFADHQFGRQATERRFDTVPYPDEPASATWSAPLIRS